MDDKKIIKELNKIISLEHVHLGMYKDCLRYEDREIRWAVKRFYELEKVHIDSLRKIITNLGGKPAFYIEGGELPGKIFGKTVNLSNTETALNSFKFVEKKSHQAYLDFIDQLEIEDSTKESQLIGELLVPNMLDAELMKLWFKNKIKKMKI